jgi:hypothetical protein
MKQTFIQEISATINAYNNCIATGNTKWADNHLEALKNLSKKLPSGSGFDSGTTISLFSTKNEIYFNTSFHHMDENGGYDGWTDHKIVVTPTFTGIDITVRGEDRNEINDYIADIFYDCLTEEIE